VIDSRSDLDTYKLLILPDTITIDEDLAGRLRDYLENGGSLIASHRSGLRPDGSAFALPQFGVHFKGEAPFSPDFVRPTRAFGTALAPTPHVMYERALDVAPRKGTRILAHTVEPYFNRTWQHYCSHRHTPAANRKGGPAVLQHGAAVYFAHPLFTLYRTYAPQWCRVLFLEALDRLLSEPLIRAGGPSTLLVTVNEQRRPRRRILHFLHYVPIRRGEQFDTIEDVYPLTDIPVSLREDRPAKRVALVPEDTDLAFDRCAGRISFTLPRLDGYQLVSIDT
jgi:hypothetical protein